MRIIQTIVLLVFFVSPIRAATVDVSNNDTINLFANAAEYFEDTSSNLKVDEIAEYVNKFQPLKEGKLTRGFSSSTYWLRVTIRNVTSKEITRWIEVGPQELQNVSLHKFFNGHWSSVQSGVNVPAIKKPLKSVSALIPITLSSNESQTYLIQVKSESSLNITIMLWEPMTYMAATARSQMVAGVAFGAILITALLSILFYVRDRYPFQLYLSTFLLCASILRMQKTGLLQLYFWPETISFSLGVGIAASIGSISAGLCFIQDLLDLKNNSRFFNRVFAYFLYFYPLGEIVVMGISLRVAIQAHTFALSFLIPLSIMATAYVVFRGKKGLAMFLIAEVMIFPACVFPFLYEFGVQLPFSEAPWIQAVFIFMPLTALVFLFGSDEQVLYREKEASLLRSMDSLESMVMERTFELTTAMKLAKDANWAKTELLARVNHDLRSPLHTIVGYANLIRKKSSRVSLDDAVSAITYSAQRLLELIDELLEYARGNIGKLRISPEMIDWQLFVKLLRNDVCNLASASDNSSDVEVDGDFPNAIFIDSFRLRQVLDNLVSNANRHTKNGLVRIKISSQIISETVYLKFVISDTGCGIDYRKLPYLFEPTVEGASGIGLGLSISRHIVRSMGGELALIENSPRGCAFGFELICPVASCSTMQKSSNERKHIINYDRSRCTLLIVDDNQDNLRLLKNILEDCGFLVLAAMSGQQAIIHLNQRNDIELVITDLLMMNGDGVDVVNAAHQLNPDFPVILLSGSSYANDSENQRISNRFSAILPKPADGDQLLNAIGKLLNLTWIYATELTSHLSKNEASFPASTSIADEDLNQLKELIDLGLLTDITEWIQWLEKQSDFQGNQYFIDQLNNFANHLDFTGLMKYASLHAR